MSKRIPLKAARVAAGLTQEELAQKMEVSRQSIINWENGDSEIKLAFLRLYCDITGFSVDDIILPSESTYCRR